MKVMFIGTDPETTEIATLSVRLRWPDVTTLIAQEAGEGLEIIEEQSPDMVLLQPNFSDLSLSEAIQRLRGFSDVPLLVLSQRDDGMEAVSALELGADDYVRLPCDVGELAARMFAILRRVGIGTTHDLEQPAISGELLINPATHEVLLRGQRVMLTPTEFRLLYLLVRNQGILLSHHWVRRVLWGDRAVGSAIEVKYIQLLRRKLGDDPKNPVWIANVSGVGYRFVGAKTDKH